MRLNAKRGSDWAHLGPHDIISLLLGIGIIFGVLALSPSFWVMLKVI